MKDARKHYLDVGGCKVTVTIHKFDDGVWHGRAQIDLPAQTDKRTYAWETFACTEHGILDAVNKRAERIADGEV
jgi:hypothetical protein